MTGPRYARSPAVLWRRTYDRVLFLVPSTGELLSLAGTGLDLWVALSEPVTVSSVASTLADQYGTEPAAIEGDIASTLSELVEHGVLLADR